jgi:hypothetical protein
VKREAARKAWHVAVFFLTYRRMRNVSNKNPGALRSGKLSALGVGYGV